MRITLYQNMSEPNYVNKTLTNPIPVDGTMRDQSSVLNPVFRIATTSEGIVFSNYLLIDEWHRYYYINDIISVRQGLWEIHAHVDVLMTFKNQFLPLGAIVARQEYLYNLYLDDNKFLVNAPRMVVTKAFPNRVIAGNSSGALSFVLTLAGGADTTTTTE